MAQYEDKLNQILQETSFEFGTGVWLSPAGERIPLPHNMIHSDWARKNGETLGSLLRKGWARIRIMSDDLVGESYNPDHVFDIRDMASAYGVDRITFIWYRHDDVARKFEFGVDEEVPIIEARSGE